MAKLALKVGKKKVKDQFVIIIGDDGAILCHYLDNQLSSRVFVDSPSSEDIKLFEKLLGSYPNHPVSLLVDVMEQSYTQQVLPPVSSIGLVPQIERRIKRDLRDEDLNNFMVMGRSQDGRKDWNVLFISLANTEPFASWLEFLIKQENKLGGIFLLPVESVKLVQDLRGKLADTHPPEWEILLLHNKTGGFRIVTYKNDKLVFARLAQNLIGESIPEVVVGNLEQELQNTFEYLKRLGFRTESASKVTIVAAADILEKLDTKLLKFSEINLFTPYQISELAGLPDSVNEKDKFADVFMATYFATQRTHLLKFHSKYTKMLDNMYLATKALLAVLVVGLVAGLGYEASKISRAMTIHSDLEQVRNDFKIQTGALNDGRMKLEKEKTEDAEKQVSVYNLYQALPSDKYVLLNILSRISPEFGQDKVLTGFTFTNANKIDPQAASVTQKNTKNPAAAKPAGNDIANFKNNAQNYDVVVNIDFVLPESKSDDISKVSQDFMVKLQKLLPDMKVEYSKAPVSKQQTEFEFLAEKIDNKPGLTSKFPAEITIKSNKGGRK